MDRLKNWSYIWGEGGGRALYDVSGVVTSSHSDTSITIALDETETSASGGRSAANKITNNYISLNKIWYDYCFNDKPSSLINLGISAIPFFTLNVWSLPCFV